MKPEAPSTLSSQARLSTITDYLSSLPHTRRAAAVETIQQELSEPEAAELRFAWSLHARDSQLPPPVIPVHAGIQFPCPDAQVWAGIPEGR